MVIKKKIFLICLVMFIIVGFSINILAAEQEVLVAGMDPHGVPWAYIDEQGDPAGFTVEAIDWIAQEMGFEVEHKPISWDAIISTLLAGQLDFIGSGMTITEERQKVVDFTIPYMQIDQAVCVREDSDLNMIEALAGEYQVGTQRGCTAAMWIEDNLVQKGILEKDKVSLFEGFDLAVESLMNGRIDSAMMDDVMLGASIEGKPLKIVGTLITGELYGYAVRKDDEELKSMLNEGLRRLMESAKWNELKAKYIPAGISK
jgi:polar amino acid transport system substrate-binding protein